MCATNASLFTPRSTKSISTTPSRPRWPHEPRRKRDLLLTTPPPKPYKDAMAYSVRHITKFSYEPAVRESVMEVRMQPRTDARQRCMTFSLGVLPQASVMVYRDFFGNVVHHFDIPGRTNLIEIDAQAIVDVLPP